MFLQSLAFLNLHEIDCPKQDNKESEFSLIRIKLCGSVLSLLIYKSSLVTLLHSHVMQSYVSIVLHVVILFIAYGLCQQYMWLTFDAFICIIFLSRELKPKTVKIYTPVGIRFAYILNLLQFTVETVKVLL